ncbi:MAG: M20 family peptidase [Actinomycetota bacterium]|nr:MAG: M20 family peptidase [Actinomycetota bacterium]
MSDQLQVSKARAFREVHDFSERLIELSHKIHSTPELGYLEFNACEWLSEELKSFGYSVIASPGGLETAFVASAGTGPLVLSICAEYDALPEIGHACGHNIIAAAAIGAAKALAPLVDDLNITLKIMGTPAEEGGGGKIEMIDIGLFNGIHASMMVHPSAVEADRMDCFAGKHLNVQYVGKSAHAAGFPQAGINSQDAMTIAQVAIGLLRQHLYPYEMVHGIVTKGGDAPNVIPSDTRGRWIIRADTLAQLELLEPKIRSCFEAGAVATGAKVEITQASKTYSEFITDERLAALYVANALSLGRTFTNETRGRLKASTDMANVSLKIPSIHPMLGINSYPAVNHQPEFTAACITQTADKAVLDGAAAMAQTVIDAAMRPEIRSYLLERASSGPS